jgi:hypothetical protein
MYSQHLPGPTTSNRHYSPQTAHGGTCRAMDGLLPASPQLRYQVILAGNGFFHIKETATGRVRGFRMNHNEACALARTFEVSH